MKKNFKFILGFIAGAILCTTIGVMATLSYAASQIQYKNTTLDLAMNELYNEVNTDILQKLNLSPSKVQYYESYGTRENRSLNINLNPGKYLIFSSFVYTGNGSSLPSSSGTTQSPRINSDNCSLLAGRKNDSIATSQVGSTNIAQYNHNSIYVCDITDAETITINSIAGESISFTSNVISQVVKLD